MIYFSKHKIEVFEKFKIYKAFVEKQTRNNLKVYRFNGGGYISHEFNGFCEKHGIFMSIDHYK
jgi:hypothetical protein